MLSQLFLFLLQWSSALFQLFFLMLAYLIHDYTFTFFFFQIIILLISILARIILIDLFRELSNTNQTFFTTWLRYFIFIILISM